MIVYSDRKRVPFEIDDDDYESVSHYFWRINRYGYPVTDVGRYKFGRRVVSLHLFLLGPAPENLEWDHRDRNKLNNGRDNLRAVTHHENLLNIGLPKNNKSGVCGVRKAGKKWMAQISFNGRCIYLGTFSRFEMACSKRWAAESMLRPRMDSK